MDKPSVGWVQGGEEPDTDTETGPGGGQEAGNPSRFEAECGAPGTGAQPGLTAWPGAPRVPECQEGAGGPSRSCRLGLCPCGRSRGQPLDDEELPEGLAGRQSSIHDVAQGRWGARAGA